MELLFNTTQQKYQQQKSVTIIGACTFPLLRPKWGMLATTQTPSCYITIKNNNKNLFNLKTRCFNGNRNLKIIFLPTKNNQKHLFFAFCRWHSFHEQNHTATCWARSTARPTWQPSSCGRATTPTGSTPLTYKRATGWVASEPSGTPDTTGEHGGWLG